MPEVQTADSCFGLTGTLQCSVHIFRRGGGGGGSTVASDG